MTIINEDELKSIQLEILKDVDRFCNEHGLRYSLAFGTLLGAIRHKGYIPWDDDIDIMMLRKDYDVFVKTYCSERFSVISNTTCSKYQIPFAKVHDPSTVMHELSSIKTSFGVYIDVFPIDNYPSDDIEFKRFLKQKSLLNFAHDVKTTALRRGRTWCKNLMLAGAKLLMGPLSVSSISHRIDVLARKYSDISTGYAGVFTPTDSRPKWRMPSSIFDDYITVQFEDSQFSAIKNYDLYLSATYGNYMQLPPENQRQSHHTHLVYHK